MELVVRYSHVNELAHNEKFGLCSVRVHYPEYDLAIVKTDDFAKHKYTLTDIKSGMSVRRFTKLVDAKTYVSTPDFKEVYNRVMAIRVNNKTYAKYCEEKRKYMVSKKLINQKGII